MAVFKRKGKWYYRKLCKCIICNQDIEDTDLKNVHRSCIKVKIPKDASEVLRKELILAVIEKLEKVMKETGSTASMNLDVMLEGIVDMIIQKYKITERGE